MHDNRERANTERHVFGYLSARFANADRFCTDFQLWRYRHGKSALVCVEQTVVCGILNVKPPKSEASLKLGPTKPMPGEVMLTFEEARAAVRLAPCIVRFGETLYFSSSTAPNSSSRAIESSWERCCPRHFRLHLFPIREIGNICVTFIKPTPIRSAAVS